MSGREIMSLVAQRQDLEQFRKKNWIGTFAVPWAVINDSRLLASLPDRDFRCSFSEAVKAVFPTPVSVPVIKKWRPCFTGR